MPEHLIRLRGAWQREGEDAGRIDLPTTWGPSPQGLVLLTRRFGRPRIDPTGEALALRLAEVPGLRSIRLNGRVLRTSGPIPGDLDLEFDGPLPSKNLLELEVEPSAAGEAPWGSIALVIRPKSAEG